MINFGASKPRVGGGARAPGAPPGSAPEMNDHICSHVCFNSTASMYSSRNTCTVALRETKHRQLLDCLLIKDSQNQMLCSQRYVEIFQHENYH